MIGYQIESKQLIGRWCQNSNFFVGLLNWDSCKMEKDIGPFNEMELFSENTAFLGLIQSNIYSLIWTYLLQFIYECVGKRTSEEICCHKTALEISWMDPFFTMNVGNNSHSNCCILMCLLFSICMYAYFFVMACQILFKLELLMGKWQKVQHRTGFKTILR